MVDFGANWTVTVFAIGLLVVNWLILCPIAIHYFVRYYQLYRNEDEFIKARRPRIVLAMILACILSLLGVLCDIFSDVIHADLFVSGKTTSTSSFFSSHFSIWTGADANHWSCFCIHSVFSFFPQVRHMFLFCLR